MLLIVRDLTTYYGTLKSLNRVSFTVNQGEIVALIGPNGSGKSTALKAVTGLLKTTGGEIGSGEISFCNESLKDIPPHNIIKKGICLVPEGRRVFSSMTVLENLEMGAYTLKEEDIRKACENIFNLFPILKDRQTQKAGALSGGEQQMLAIGRALMIQPKLLLLDEPSLGLSPSYVDTIFEKLISINKAGTSALLVEQKARMALEIAHRGYVFKMGEIFVEDTGANLLNNEEIKKAFLGE